jgi:polar amino acid transport system substrate-binding protein
MTAQSAISAQNTSSLRKTVIMAGGEDNYPPYGFLDEKGRPAGFNVELTREIAEVIGMKVEIRFGDWADMRKALEAGNIDVLMGMAYSESRAKIYDFSPPYTIVYHSIYARKGFPVVSSLEEHRGKEVIVQKNGIAHDYFVQKKINAHLVLKKDVTEVLKLLASGKHDYAVTARLPGEFMVKELGLNNIVPVARHIEARYYLCYAFRKGDSELMSKFAEGLVILRQSGKYQALQRKWLGVLEDDGENRLPWSRIFQYGSMILIPLLLLLSGTIVWSRMLQKQVAQRTSALSLEIAERKRAERELRERHRQLIQAAKLTAIGTLTSGVAHEINNPNALILLNTPVLDEAFRDALPILEDYYQAHGDFMLGGLYYSRMRAEVPFMFSEMMEGAKQIKRIVEDLKDFARRDDSDLAEDVSLNSVVEKAVRLTDNLIKKSTDHFEVCYEDNLALIRGNSRRIEQVVVNLIMNACQALQHRGKGLFLRTFYDAAKEEAVLEVRDEGEGIAAENLSHITDPFFTTKREKGGTGLGLSLSATIVKEHGGTLMFSSVVGEGTTCLLSLPAKKGTVKLK